MVIKCNILDYKTMNEAHYWDSWKNLNMDYILDTRSIHIYVKFLNMKIIL